MNKKDIILLGHGSGGKLSHDLINSIFVKYFDNNYLKQQTDSSILDIGSNKIAYTTDSFVVDPIFFPGGNIGNLAVAGTVNDLAVSGATPKYLSCGFIIEEGFSISDLEEIVKSMADEAKQAGVVIVTGDTKVVDRGKCDKIFINTSGIGIIDEKKSEIGTAKNITIGDKIIINGNIGDHGMAVMSARNDLKINSDIKTDSACLNHLIANVLEHSNNIKFMRDATRGGIGTVLSELAKNRKFGIHLKENYLPIDEGVRGMCELLGFDPLYVANEGKVIMVVGSDDAEEILEIMKKDKYGKNAAIIGEIKDEHHGTTWLETIIGGKRIIDMLSGQQLPRIC